MAEPSASRAKERASVPLWAAFVILLALVLATQLGGLAKEVIDWDEQTFILMGDDVASGHLLYAERFDLKPPVIFLLIGATIALFGDSLAAVRLLGDALLLGTALLVFIAARRIVSPLWALAGAVVTVLLCTADFAQHTASELPAMLAMTATFALLAASRVSLAHCAAAGACIALAILTRTNLAPLAVALGLLLLAAPWLGFKDIARMGWFAFGLGGIGVVLAITLPYLIAGRFDLFWMANVEVPLSYAGQDTMLSALLSHLSQYYWTIREAPLIYGAGTLLAILGLIGVAKKWREQRWATVLLLAMTGAVVVSILIGGAAYPHYWMQLFPFFGLLTVLAIDWMGRYHAGALAAAALLAAMLASALVERVPSALAVATDPQGYDADFAIRAAARHIEHTGGPDPSIWAWRHHLVYWYTGAPLLSKAATHPDNIVRAPIISALTEHGYVPGGEIERIAASRPEFVITDAKGLGEEWLAESGRRPAVWLARYYKLDARYDDVLVYRRRN